MTTRRASHRTPPGATPIACFATHGNGSASAKRPKAEPRSAADARAKRSSTPSPTRAPRSRHWRPRPRRSPPRPLSARSDPTLCASPPNANASTTPSAWPPTTPSPPSPACSPPTTPAPTTKRAPCYARRSAPPPISKSSATSSMCASLRCQHRAGPGRSPDSAGSSPPPRPSIPGPRSPSSTRSRRTDDSTEMISLCQEVWTHRLGQRSRRLREIDCHAQQKNTRVRVECGDRHLEGLRARRPVVDPVGHDLTEETDSDVAAGDPQGLASAGTRQSVRVVEHRPQHASLLDGETVVVHLELGSVQPAEGKDLIERARSLGGESEQVLQHGERCSQTPWEAPPTEQQVQDELARRARTHAGAAANFEPGTEAAPQQEPANEPELRRELDRSVVAMWTRQRQRSRRPPRCRSLLGAFGLVSRVTRVSLASTTGRGSLRWRSPRSHRKDSVAA